MKGVVTLAWFASTAMFAPIGATAWAETLLQGRPAAASGSGASTVALQEVIVTAQKRETNLQKTPAAIVSLDGAQLVQAGVREARDLQKLVPGLNIQQAGSFSQFYLRGVGSPVNGPLQDPAVAFNLDGVYISQPTGTHGVFYDLQRVEVLKGPQGTLYGRNATAGAINVITNRPAFDESANIALEFGNFGHLELTGYVNHPLSETIALRAAFQTDDHDGYLNDGYNDQHSRSARLGLLWRPDDATTLLLAADYVNEYGKGAVSVPYPYLDPNDPWVGPSDPRFASRSLAFDFGEHGSVDNTNWGVSASLERRFGFGTLDVLAAHRVTDIDGYFYIANSINTQKSHSYLNSVEVRLASNDDAGPLTWLVGAYYFDEHIKSDQLTDQIDMGSLDSIIIGARIFLRPYYDRSYAAFTQETLALTPQLRLTGGVRYSKEYKKKDGYGIFYQGLPTTLPETGSLRFEKVNYYAGVEYDLAPHSLLYANVSTGFKAGGFNVGAAPSPLNATPDSYRPEKLTAYTVGTKNLFFDGRLQVNLEAFYWDYQDRQYNVFQTLNTGAPPSPLDPLYLNTVNTEKAHVQGVEFDVRYQITPADLLTLSGDFIPEATADRFTFQQVLVPPPAGCRTVAAFTYNCDGSPLPNTSKWSGNIGYQHNFDLTTGARVTAEFNGRFQSDFYGDVTRNAATRQTAYLTGDVALTYQSPDAAWYVMGFVRNVTDQIIKVGALAAPGAPGESLVDLAPPRTFGVRVNARF
jgi:iron complex outermembrane receptor protein